MGIFGKLKQQMNIGGVKVKLEAPASANMTDASLTVQAHFTNGDNAQTIKSVVVELYKEDEVPVTATNNAQNTSHSPSRAILATTTFSEPFALQPQETKQLPFVLPLNTGNFAAQNLQSDSPVAQMANVLGKLQSVSEALDTGQHRYYVAITADIDNAAMSASDRVQIQLVKPGQIGGGFNVHL